MTNGQEEMEEEITGVGRSSAIADCGGLLK